MSTAAISSRCRSAFPISSAGRRAIPIRRTASRRSLLRTCSAAGCSPRSILRPTSRRSPTSMRCRIFRIGAPINAQALITGRMSRQSDGRLKAEFRLWDVLSGQQLGNGQQYLTTPDNWRRIAHIIPTRSTSALTGEKGYFDSRVVFVDETGPKQRRVKRLAHHGPGRRQCALSHARRRTRADAALLAVDAGNHLHGVRPGRSARLSAQHRDRPARDCRQFPRHEFFAALFAGRPARHHEPAGGLQLQSSSSWTCARRRRRG